MIIRSLTPHTHTHTHTQPRAAGVCEMCVCVDWCISPQSVVWNHTLPVTNLEKSVRQACF